MSQQNYKIAVNTRLLLKNGLEGIGWYKYHILKRWVENNPEHTFYFLFDRKYDESFIFGDNVVPVVLSPQSRHPILWYIWFEWSVSKWVKKNNPDVLVSMDNYTSIAASCKKFTTIHDIAYEFFDNQISPLKEKYMRHFTKKFAENSDVIATVSESTKDDIVKKYGVSKDKIVVAYNAPSGNFVPRDESFKTQFKVENTEGCDYFLYVGSIHPRKNVLSLLKAFEQYKRNTSAKTKLVVIGRMAWDFGDVESFISNMKHRDDLILIPHSPPQKIAEWMSVTSALILVSHYEGFGIPIVEAMACEVPVICSNVSSMPEVAGETALVVEPENIELIVDAMSQVLKEEVNNKLVNAAKERKKIFSWDQSADDLWRELEKLFL